MSSRTPDRIVPDPVRDNNFLTWQGRMDAKTAGCSVARVARSCFSPRRNIPRRAGSPTTRATAAETKRRSSIIPRSRASSGEPPSPADRPFQDPSMKVLVPVKRVVDFNVKVRVKPDGSGVDTANVKMSMNPFDEIAVEESVRLKEKGRRHGNRPPFRAASRRAQETLRTALAMGRRSRDPGRVDRRPAAARSRQAAQGDCRQGGRRNS